MDRIKVDVMPTDEKISDEKSAAQWIPLPSYFKRGRGVKVLCALCVSARNI